MTKLEKKLLLVIARYILWLIHPPARNAKHVDYTELSHLIGQVEAEGE